MTTHAPSAASRVAIALPMPLAAPVTRAMRPAWLRGLGHPLELGLLERPVLDAELLGLVDGRVGRHRLGAAHDVDRVDVELAGDARGLLVLAVGEHPDAGHEHDGRVGPAHRGGVGGGVALVVGRVVLAVCRVQLAEARDASPRPWRRTGRSTTRGLTLVRRKWSGHDVPSSARRASLSLAEEVEHDVGVAEVAHHRAVLGGDGPDVRRQRRGLRAPLGLRQGGIRRRPLRRRARRCRARRGRPARSR